jgi:serine protease inhibitor
MKSTVDAMIEVINQTDHMSNVCVSPYSLSKIITMNNKMCPNKIKINSHVKELDCIEDFDFAVGNKETLSEYFENVYDRSEDISKIIKIHTHGKIVVDNNLFVNSPTLVNCIYFKSNWIDRTNPFTSCEINFNDKLIPGFRGNGAMKYYSCAEFAAIELPYDNGAEMMFINIPKLDKRYLNIAFHSECINFQIPSFEIKAHSTDFSNLLSKYGMDPCNTCIQLIYIKVDKTGTEAAAMTRFSLGMEKIFSITSPFSFILHKGNEILFMGIISNI